MKKCLLLILVAMLNISITQGQSEGYSWSFGAEPFTSVPAITGSPGTYTLQVIEFLGDHGITVQTEQVANGGIGLGTSCTAPIPVGEFSAAPDFFLFGLIFDNNPQFVTTTYTIEMAVKFLPTNNYHRIMGFTDLFTPGTPGSTSDYGVYLSPDNATPDEGRIIFRDANGDFYPGSPNLQPNTWYYLTFVRDATGTIKFYVDGVYYDAYDDSDGDFMPQAGGGNQITFFKDEGSAGSEESGGSIAKLSIYNRTLTDAEIQRRTFNNICNTTLLLPVTPNEGHQWVFTGTAPFPSTPAVAGSVGPFDLFDIGGSLTTGATENPAKGASCTTPVAIGNYVVGQGLEFQNTPRYIYDTYTIEMVVNIDDLTAARRLAGFEDLSSLPEATYGIHVNAAGLIDFVNAGGSHTIASGAPIQPDTWYHIVFTRNALGLISYYQDGVLIGTYDDAAGDFMPHGTTGFFITLLKDENDNESDGKIRKVGIFNAVLPLTDVQERFNNICNANLVVLPVSLKLFTAVKVNNEVQLTWTTAMEENNLGFEIQRSKDGANYTTIGFVKGAGTSSQDITYSFIDPAPLTGNNYYRLKQIDISNLATFSSIRRINMDKLTQDIHLFPNPARDIITVTNIKAGDQLSIFNTHGNLIHRKIASAGQETLGVGKLSAGVYMLQVTDKENNKRVIRFTKF